MPRILIYLFPALADLVVATMQFVCTVRAPKLGANAEETGAVVVVWCIFYMPACWLIGRVVTPRNSGPMLVAACLGLAFLSLFYVLLPGLTAMYVLMAFTGVATALFFVPFQVFMQAVDEGGEKPLAYTTALYTLSWSAGYAVAPLVAGNLMMLGATNTDAVETTGWKYGYLFSGLVCLLGAFGIWALKHHATSHPTDSAPPAATRSSAACEPVDFEKLPSYAWLAWLACGAGILALATVRTIFQEYAHELAFSDSMKGTIQFVMNITQALVGLSFYRSRQWMYRGWPALLFGACGLAGMACFGLGRSATVFLVGACFYGVYSGAFFFYLVFHALTHPATRARYVAVNEMVVGGASLAGALIGGCLADQISRSFPYLAFGSLLIPVLAFQAFIHFRDQRKFAVNLSRPRDSS